MTGTELLKMDFCGYRVSDVVPIGRGGMAWVYRGFSPTTGRAVAIKLLKPQFENGTSGYSLRAESGVHSALSNQRHPNLLEYLGNGPTHIVTELLEGADLVAFAESGTSFSLLHVLDIMLQICRGLEVIHELGLVHRDLKPDNIFLVEISKGWQVKILDFGLTVRVEDSGASETGMVSGTPSYMSPEQCGGEILDVRSDLYALGCVLYFMLTGQTLNSALHPIEAIEMMQKNAERIANDPLLRGINPGLLSLLHSLTAYEREQRPASAKTVGDTIQHMTDELTLPKRVTPPVRVQVAPPPPPRRMTMPVWLRTAGVFLTSLFSTSLSLFVLSSFYPANPADQPEAHIAPDPSQTDPIPSNPIEISADVPREERPLQCWASRGRARQFDFVRIGDIKAAADQRCWEQIPVDRRQRQCRHLRRRGHSTAPLFGPYCNGY